MTSTDRKMKDVVAEAIARGLEVQLLQDAAPANTTSPAKSSQSSEPMADEALLALFATGDEMARRGVDFNFWAKHSRDVWR